MRFGPRCRIGLLAVAACNKGEEVVPVQFNGDDDILVVCVGTGDCEPVGEIDLRSTNESTLIGTASVDPASGPVGTLHTVSVDVDDTWQDQVIKVTAEFISERGDQDWLLQQDSADHGNWEIEVQSLGDPDESREDQIILRLFEDVSTTTTTEPTTTET